MGADLPASVWRRTRSFHTDGARPRSFLSLLVVCAARAPHCADMSCGAPGPGPAVRAQTSAIALCHAARLSSRGCHDVECPATTGMLRLRPRPRDMWLEKARIRLRCLRAQFVAPAEREAPIFEGTVCSFRRERGFAGRHRMCSVADPRWRTLSVHLRRFCFLLSAIMPSRFCALATAPQAEAARAAAEAAAVVVPAAGGGDGWDDFDIGVAGKAPGVMAASVHATRVGLCHRGVSCDDVCLARECFRRSSREVSHLRLRRIRMNRLSMRIAGRVILKELGRVVAVSADRGLYPRYKWRRAAGTIFETWHGGSQDHVACFAHMRPPSIWVVQRGLACLEFVLAKSSPSWRLALATR